MRERDILVASGILGSLAGVAIGYMFFTESGRRWRVEAEDSLSTIMQEAERLLSAADQVRQSVADLKGSARSGYPRSA
jgi:membrane protein YqaA with SNARE-associated domain